MKNLEQTLNIFTSSANLVIILAFIIMMFGNNRKDRWILFSRSLQFIIILTLICIPFPPLELKILQEIYNIAFFDILGQYDILSYLTFFKFNDSIDVPFIIQQMQSISFNSRNTFLGLGTVSIILLAYFALVFLVAVFKILIMISG